MPAYQYLSAVQDLLKPMGIAPALAAEMSNEVVKLAADLGSFNNVPTDRVIQDINSALVGNFETMKKYGVVLNETTIKQEAMNMGLWDGKGVIDASTKAQVAFALSLKGSADAQGDMLRTAGSFANVMKASGKRLEDLGAMIGKELLPGLSSLGLAFIETSKDGGVLFESVKAIAKLLSIVFGGWAALMSRVNAEMDAYNLNDATEDMMKYSKQANSAKKELLGLGYSQAELNRIQSTGKRETGLKNKGALLSREIEFIGQLTGAQSRSNDAYAKATKLKDVAAKSQERYNFILKQAQGEEDAVASAVSSREEEKTETVKKGANNRAEVKKVAQQAFNDFMKGSNAETSADLLTHYETILEMDGISNEQRLEAYQAYLEQKKEMDMVAANNAMQVMQTTSQGIQNILSLVNKRKNIMLDNQYKKEKAAIMNNVKDEEERKKRIEALDQKFEAKKSALRKEQAKEEKAMALMNAVINTAVGITSALSAPWPMNMILPGIIGALGAAEIGLIAATPIPAAEGALIQGSQSGTLMQAGEGGASEAIIPLENEEAMEKLEPILGGGSTSIIINVENLYATEDVPENMAMAIDQALLDLRQNNNSAFSTAVEGK